MSISFQGLVGALEEAGRRLVTPANALAPLLIQRAQVQAASTVLGADGLSWSQIGADTPRFQGTARPMLVETQRTNGLRNPRAEGSVAGSPGTLPTHWSASSPAGSARSVIGSGAENGIGYVEIEWVFTAAATVDLGLDAATVAATAGAGLAVSAFVRAITNTAPGTIVLNVQSRNVGGSQLDAMNHAVTPTNAALGSQRWGGATTQVANVTQANVNLRIAATGAGTVRLRIGWPQAEIGAFASTPILPGAGNPVASTRGAEIVAAPLSSLGIKPNGACTLLLSGVLPHASPAAGSFNLLRISDGTDINRIFVRDNGGTNLLLWRVTAGIAANVACGSYTASAPLRLGLSLNGAGRAAVSFNGAAAVAITGAPIAGLTSLNLSGLVAEWRLARALPFALADDRLATATLAL